MVHEDLPGPYEILEARGLIEGETAALAAARMSNEELQELGQLLRRLIAEIDRGDIEAAEKMDQQFHLTIARGSRNSALLATVTWLWELRNNSEIAAVFHRHAREEGSTSSQEERRSSSRLLESSDSMGTPTKPLRKNMKTPPPSSPILLSDASNKLAS